MTHQSQQKWSVIQNILLIINKLWRQQHGRAVKKRLLVKLVNGTRWRGKRQVAASSNTSKFVGGNFPIFGVMILQESGIRAGGSLKF